MSNLYFNVHIILTAFRLGRASDGLRRKTVRLLYTYKLTESCAGTCWDETLSLIDQSIIWFRQLAAYALATGTGLYVMKRIILNWAAGLKSNEHKRLWRRSTLCMRAPGRFIDTSQAIDSVTCTHLFCVSSTFVHARRLYITARRLVIRLAAVVSRPNEF
jgi:hypothetical protein